MTTLTAAFCTSPSKSQHFVFFFTYTTLPEHLKKHVLMRWSPSAQLRRKYLRLELDFCTVIDIHEIWYKLDFQCFVSSGSATRGHLVVSSISLLLMTLFQFMVLILLNFVLFAFSIIISKNTSQVPFTQCFQRKCKPLVVLCLLVYTRTAFSFSRKH